MTAAATVAELSCGGGGESVGGGDIAAATGAGGSGARITGGATGGDGGVNSTEAAGRMTGGGTTELAPSASRASATGAGSGVGGRGDAATDGVCGLSSRQRSDSLPGGTDADRCLKAEGTAGVFLSLWARVSVDFGNGGFVSVRLDSVVEPAGGGWPPIGTRTSLWHLGHRNDCPARLSETISECPEGHLIRSGMRHIPTNREARSLIERRHMPTLSVCSELPDRSMHLNAHLMVSKLCLGTSHHCFCTEC